MKTITLTAEQYETLCAGESITIEPHKPKIEKWQPKRKEWFVTHTGKVEYNGSFQYHSTEFGNEYPTKEAAEKARDAMRNHNRLLAWLAENDDGWVADWNNHKQAKFSLFQNVYNGFWSFENSTQYMKLGTVYMSYKNANKLCDLLNSGEVVL